MGVQWVLVCHGLITLLVVFSFLVSFLCGHWPIFDGCCKPELYYRPYFDWQDFNIWHDGEFHCLLFYVKATGGEFPLDPKKLMQLAINAIFDSWDSPRANKYRSINQITGLKEIVVNIQTMVFGIMGNTSDTGVLFTRNPSMGEKKLYGEFLINAQGEDAVAGIRTPEDLDTMKIACLILTLVLTVYSIIIDSI